MQTVTWTKNDRILISTGTTCEVMTPVSDASRYFATEGQSILSPDGTLVAIDDIDNVVRVRAVIASGGQWKAGTVLFACQGLEDSPVLGYAWSPDGKTLAVQQQSGTSTYQISGWASRQGQRKGVYRPSQPSDTPRPMAFAPNGTRIAEAVHSGIALWDAATGRLVRMIGQGAVESVAWDAAGNYLALGKSDGKVAIYSMRKATLLTDQVAHGVAVSALAWMDIYAAGVLLRELLTGKKPSKDMFVLDPQRQASFAPDPGVYTSLPDAQRAFCRMLDKMTEPYPALRLSLERAWSELDTIGQMGAQAA